MIYSKQVAQGPSPKDKLVNIEITENGRQVVKKGPQANIEHEETDIM